jgi:serine/threonine protein kinase
MSRSGDSKPGDEPADDRPGSVREQLIAKAVADFLDLRAQGRRIDAEAFCRLHPDLANDLLSDLRTLDEIDSVFGDDDGNEAPAQPDEPLPERLSGHKILGLIGSGGMGRVLLANDEGLGRRVAIKSLSPRYLGDQGVRTRFMHEARAMARLSHPNIVRIYNLGLPDEMPHFVMEYVQGVTLTEACRALSLEQKVEVVHRIVLAVEFLHRNGMVHRDLKPGNILVGADLEPKLLDFGLAQRSDESGNRVTQAGQAVGTPDYFSPEQACADPNLDTRSDIFSLGAVLYELLTGTVPFRGATYPEHVRQICEQDPVLPRRLNAAIPGSLQNICMKCLEKKREDRYGSARELADDLERFLADEPVLAAPVSYSRMITGRIEQHLRELGGWREDRILSDNEFDAFRKLYDRLVEKEDAWILEVRRLSLSQVTLYLGAWVLFVGAALLLLFRLPALSGAPAVALVSGVTAPTAWIGVRCWNRGQVRIAIAYLLAFCVLFPTAMLVGMKESGILAGFTKGKQSLELLSPLAQTGPGGTVELTTNAQLWWAILVSLPVYLWLRRFTRASVFSLAFAAAGAALCVVTLLRLGMIEWLQDDPGRFYFRLLPFAALYFIAAFLIEKNRCHADSRYFYPIAVLFTYVALSGVAGFHEPYARWLNSWLPRTRGQVEYLFVINAAIYLVLQNLSEGVGTAQLRSVAKAFRFVIPGHVLVSILLLGLEASRRWDASPADVLMRHEARFFEILLPALACLFVFGSVPKQMKNYFAAGLLFVGIGMFRLQQDLFRDKAGWAIALLAAGTTLMLAAANYTPLKLALTRFARRLKR